MTALLATLAVCLAIIGWNLCAMIRDAVARERWRKLADKSFDELRYGDWPSISALKLPHNDEDIGR